MMACKRTLLFILLSLLGSLHVGSCLSLAKGEAAAREIPGLTVVVVSAAVILLLAYVVIGCVCCPNRSIKALSYQNGFPASRLNENSQLEGGSEFAIFPPQSAVIDLQPVAFDDKVTFEPLPDVLPLRNPSSARPPHFRALLRNKVSLHDWFDDPSLNFPRDQLQYFRELGCGWFGRVVEGEAANIFNTEEKTPVVVKILREEASPSEHLHFLHEVRAYRDLSHPNVLRLLGRCLESDPFLLILEHSTSNLKSYLNEQESKEVLLKNGSLLQMACNVVSGLKHLHDNGYTHLDLAAHNCFVCRDSTVKIGDYGISFDQCRGDYYCLGDIALPIRWCSPETLICTESTIEMKEISKEANIWSFGVVLWEIFEFGRLPYEELSNEEVLQKVLIERSVLLSPPSRSFPAKNEVCIVMQECWKTPKLRPTVHKLELFLSRLSNDHHNLQTLHEEHSFEERWNALKRSGDEGSDATSSFDPISRDGRLSPSMRVLNGSADELTDVCLTDDFSASNDLEVSVGSDLPLDGQWTGSMDGVLIGGGGSLERRYLDHNVGDLQYHSLERAAGKQKLCLDRSASNNYAPDLPLDGLQWSGSTDAVLSGRNNMYLNQGANSNNVQYNSLDRAIRPTVAPWEQNAAQFDSNVAAFGNNLERAFGHQGFHSDQNVLDKFGVCESFSEVSQKPSRVQNFHSDQNVSGNKFSVYNSSMQSGSTYPNFYSDHNVVNGLAVDDNFNQLSDGETPLVERDVIGEFSVVVDMQGKEVSKAVPDIVIHESPLVAETSHDENENVMEEEESSPCHIAETPKTFRFVFKEEKGSEGSSHASNKRERPLTSTPMKSSDFVLNCSDELSQVLNNGAGEVFGNNSFTESSKVGPPENQTEGRDSEGTVFIETRPDVNNSCFKASDFASAQSEIIRGSNISNDLKTSFSNAMPEKASEIDTVLPSAESNNVRAFAHETESSNNGNSELLKCPSSLKRRNELEVSRSDSVSLECGEPYTPDVSINISSSFSYGNNDGSLDSPPHLNDHQAEDFATPDVSTMNVSGLDTGLLELPSHQDVTLESIGEVNTPDVSINVSSCSYGNEEDGSMDSPLEHHHNSQKPLENKESGTPDLSISYDCSMDSPPLSPDRLHLDDERRQPVTPDVSINVSSCSMDSPPDQLPPLERKHRIDSEDPSSSDLLDSFSDSSFPNRMEAAANARPDNHRLLLMQGYDEVVVEDLETGEQTVSYSTDYEETSDEILKVDTETDEAIIVDASEALVGFVPSRSIELLQECEILPPTYVIHEESSESNHLDASDSASSSPGCRPSPEVMFHRNFCLQDEVIEEEITEEMASPSLRSTLSSEGLFSEERPTSQGSPEHHLEDDSEGDEAYDDHQDWRDENAWQEQQDVPPLVIEGREILAGGMLETHGMSVKDLTTALNNLDHLSVSQSPSPYSSLESSPCREAYTPDFDSEDEEDSESCSSTSGSFECLNNRFKAMGDISQLASRGESEPPSRERSPCKVFSGTWDCNATPTKGLLLTPEKKLSSMRKSVSFHEEDMKVVYEYPPQSDSSEDNEPVHQWTVDYENYEDWELQVGDNDEEIEEVLEIEELEEEPYVRRPVSRPMSLYSLTSGFSDDDMDSSAAPSNSPEEGKHGPLSESQISNLIRDQLSSLALEENRLRWMQDALESQASAFQESDPEKETVAQLQDEENPCALEEEEIGLEEYDEDITLNKPFPKDFVSETSGAVDLPDATNSCQVKAPPNVPQKNSVVISKELEWELQEPVMGSKPNGFVPSSFDKFGGMQLSLHDDDDDDWKDDFSLGPFAEVTPSVVEMTLEEGNRRPGLSAKSKGAFDGCLGDDVGLALVSNSEKSSDSREAFHKELSDEASFDDDVGDGIALVSNALNQCSKSSDSKEAFHKELSDKASLDDDVGGKIALVSNALNTEKSSDSMESFHTELSDKALLPGNVEHNELASESQVSETTDNSESQSKAESVEVSNQLISSAESNKPENFPISETTDSSASHSKTESKDVSAIEVSNKVISSSINIESTKPDNFPSSFTETASFENTSEGGDSSENVFLNKKLVEVGDLNEDKFELLVDSFSSEMPVDDKAMGEIGQGNGIDLVSFVSDEEPVLVETAVENNCSDNKTLVTKMTPSKSIPEKSNAVVLRTENIWDEELDNKDEDICNTSETVEKDKGNKFIENVSSEVTSQSLLEFSVDQILNTEIEAEDDFVSEILQSENDDSDIKSTDEASYFQNTQMASNSELVEISLSSNQQTPGLISEGEMFEGNGEFEDFTDEKDHEKTEETKEFITESSTKEMSGKRDLVLSTVQQKTAELESTLPSTSTFPSHHQESALKAKKNDLKAEPVPKIVVTPASESEFEDRELEEFLRSQLELCGNDDAFSVTSQYAVAPFDDVFGSDYPAEAFNFEFEGDESDFYCGGLDSPMVEKRRSDSEDSMAKLDSSPSLYYATSDATHL